MVTSMTDILHITLYGTEHCHLCEQANSVLQQLNLIVPCHVHYIDITTDDLIFAQYQTSIPVIHIHQLNQSLNWPFQLSDLVQILRRHQA